MSIYLDTSFLLPYYLTETTSDSVQEFIREAPPGSLHVSQWTMVEFASALARLVRMELLTDDPLVIQAQLTEHTVSIYTTLDVTPDEYRKAQQYLLHDPHLGLRGADALHAAVAHSHGKTIHTLDRRLLNCANELGVPATAARLLSDG